MTTSEARLSRAEVLATENPWRYRATLNALAYLGILAPIAVAGTIVCSLAAIGFFIHVFAGTLAQIAWAVLVPIFVAIRSIFHSTERASGTPIGPGDAPQLFALVRDLEASADTKIDGIYINHDFNLSIMEQPRWAGLASPRRDLIIGIQVMMTLNSEQLKALLAHEFGHIRGGKLRFRSWIYANRRFQGSFVRSAALHRSVVLRLLLPFYAWYVPYFRAYSLPLARRVELDADRLACEITSVQAFAAALCALYLEDARIKVLFWKPLIEAVAPTGKVPLNTFAMLKEALPALPPANPKLSEIVLAQNTGADDTHPKLRDRLVNIGVVPEGVAQTLEPVTLEESAATTLLGAYLPYVLDRANKDWATAILLSRSR